MRGVKWKYIQSVNTWYGTVKGDSEPLLSIQGSLCVTDLRETRDSSDYVSPKHYKVIGFTLQEAKNLAEDLVNGENFDKHEKNRLDWIAENERSAKVISDAEDYLKTLGITI